MLTSSAAAVLLTVWHDTAHGGTPVSSELQPSLEWEVQGSLLSSAELTTTVTVDETARYTFDCDEVRHASVILWLDDHLLCGTTELFAPGPGSAAPFPPWVVLHAGEPHFLRLRTVHNETTSALAGVALRWRKNGGAAEALPASVLSPPSDMPGNAARTARDELQRAVGSGWGSWYRPSALAATLLPEGSTLTAGLCRLSTRSCLDPSALFTPEQDRGQEEPKANASGRPGLHSYDRSFWSLSLQYDGGNVSLEWSGTNSGAGASAVQELDLVATLIGGVNVTDYALLVSASFVWHRVGTAAAINEGSAVRLTAAGLRSTTARALTPVLPPGTVDGSASQPVYIALAFGVGGAPATAVVTSDVAANVTADVVVARVRKARAAAVAQYAPEITEGTDLSEAAVAMGSCLMWNVIYHPTQLGPFVSVSRSFTQMPYELFEWDTYFGALMLSSSPYGLPIALSSMIQITKSKTVGPRLDLHGFVPGYSKGGRWLSEDRTERPIGAVMVLKIFNRWHGVGGRDLRWVLELLYDDLLDWHEWLWAKRRLPPLDLAVPGSNSCILPNGTSNADGGTPSLWCKKSWGMGELQGARFESLDNSPMYDVPGEYPLWNETLELMQLYDVGQSSAIVWECEALEVIATMLEKSSDSSKLKKARRGDVGVDSSTHVVAFAG